MANRLTAENIERALVVIHQARDFLERIEQLLEKVDLTESQRATLYDAAEEAQNAAMLLADRLYNE